jgi:hypothetical protein
MADVMICPTWPGGHRAAGVRVLVWYETLTAEEAVMEATIGDQIRIHGSCVGHPDKDGEIVEVRGTRGEPPYLVRFADGQTRLLFPGPDAVIIPRQRNDSGI